MKKRLRASKKRKILTENSTYMTEADSLPYLDHSVSNNPLYSAGSIEHKNINSF